MQVRLQRDLSAYFCCAMEVFGMTADFLRECGAVLPPTCIAPFSFRSGRVGSGHVDLHMNIRTICFNFPLWKLYSLHNICVEIVPEVVNAAGNKMFLEFLPSSLPQMRRMSKHLVTLHCSV
jgi:hypothetical protein